MKELLNKSKPLLIVLACSLLSGCTNAEAEEFLFWSMYFLLIGPICIVFCTIGMILGIVYYSQRIPGDGLKTANKVFMIIGGVMFTVTLVYLVVAMSSLEELSGVSLMYTIIAAVMFLIHIILFTTKKPEENVWDGYGSPLDQPIHHNYGGPTPPPPPPPRSNNGNNIRTDDWYNRRREDEDI